RRGLGGAGRTAVGADRIDLGQRHRGGGARVARLPDEAVVDLAAAAAVVGINATAGCGNLDAVAVVGIEGAAAGDAVGGNGDHARAVGGRVSGHVVAIVAGGDHHHCAKFVRFVDRGHVAGRARPFAAQAEVDDLGRIRVRRHAFDRAAGGPDDGVVDVALVATAVAEHAQVQDVGVVGDAGHADAVVGQLRAGGAGDVGAVPGAVALDAAFRARIADGPVAQVPAAGHAFVGLAAGHEGVGDEVVAGVGIRGVDVGMFGDAGIDHRDGDAVAVGQVPGRGHVGAAAVGPAVVGRRAVRRQHVPLVFDEVRIVRDVGRLHVRQALGAAGDLAQAVRAHRDHVRIGPELAHQRGGFDPVEAARELEQMLAAGEPAH